MESETAFGRPVRPNSHVRDETARRGGHPISKPWIRLTAAGFDEQWCLRPSPLTETACNTCNTYSVPYKGKEPKNSLSPKSLNTLIHQCITFYIFLIFQYLSLWKSVFSCN